MKNIILTSVMLTFFVLFSNKGFTQDFPGLDKSPMDVASFPSNYKNADKVVKITYSRPQLKGRTIAKLAPNSKVWRTGANEAAEITFYKDVTFGDKLVKAGTYTLFTIPGEEEWTIILSSEINVWGSYFYNESDDVVRVQAKASQNAKKIEAFSIVFKGEEEDFKMHLGWGTVVVTLPIKG